MTYRTDAHNNPTAFTTDIAKEAGLVLGTDYVQGDPFKVGESTYCTAKPLGDPVAITIRVIDAIGFYTALGSLRWEYIGMPKLVWLGLPREGIKICSKRDVIGFMYQREGGTAMRSLFPRYGEL